MEGLKAKALRDRAAGKNFKMQVFRATDTAIGTITKGYSKVRSTDPKIAHPTDPELLRQLTAAEHGRVKGVPTTLVQGLSPTVAHELLGQGIVYAPFHSVGKRIGQAMLAVAQGAAWRQVAEPASTARARHSA
jgi:DNA (cytosine-5)-methyltransferase 1